MNGFVSMTTTGHPHDGLRQLNDSSARDPLPPNQARRATRDQATAAQPPLRKRKSTRQRRVPNEYRHPCRRALDLPCAGRPPPRCRTRRRTWPPHVDRAQRVEREPEHKTMHGCYYRLRDARWGADCVLEVARGARVTSAQQYRPVCGQSTCRPTFFRGGKETEGRLWRDGRQHVPLMPAKKKFEAEERLGARTVGLSVIRSNSTP